MPHQEIPFAQLIGSIAERRHVNLVVHPFRYERDRINSLREVRDLVFSSRVSIRGWDMPHCDPKHVITYEGAVTSSFSWARYVEAWRAHKSGQFELYKLCSEEDQEYQKSLREHWDLDVKADFYLDWGNVVYSFCEYFEFVRRFAQNADLRDGVVAEITYRNMANVGISSSEFDRSLWDHEPSVDPVIRVKCDLDFDSLMVSSSRASREAVSKFFVFFGLSIRDDILRQTQERFFSMRIGGDRNLPPVL